jgi:hypothetical protein
MIVIGLTGPIGHGKTTFATALEHIEPHVRHFESSEVIAEVADAWHQTLDVAIDPASPESLNHALQSLPEVVQHVAGIACTFEQIRLDPDQLASHPVEYEKLLLHAAALQANPQLAARTVTEENKESYRPILQWLGGYLVARVDKGIWYKEIARRIERSRSEGCGLAIVGGLRYPNDAAILRQCNAKILKIYRPDYGQEDALDPTERDRNAITVDATIVNDGTLEQLVPCAKQVLKDIRDNSLRGSYMTHSFADKEL